MKLVIVTAIHQRYDLTYAFMNAMERIKWEFGIDTYAAVTYGDDCVDLLKEYHVPYIEHENQPLGKKWNAAFDMLRYVDFTHAMILGSDDIPSSKFIEVSLEQDPNDTFDIIGINGLWFWGLNPRRAGFDTFGYYPVKGVMAGPGKMVSKRAVELVDYAPWPDDCGYGMDAKMMKRIRRAFAESGQKIEMKKYSNTDAGGFIVDVKYEQHISSLSPIHRRDYYVEQNPDVVIPHHLPKDEADYLFTLRLRERVRYEKNRSKK